MYTIVAHWFRQYLNTTLQAPARQGYGATIKWSIAYIPVPVQNWGAQTHVAGLRRCDCRRPCSGFSSHYDPSSHEVVVLRPARHKVDLGVRILQIRYLRNCDVTV